MGNYISNNISNNHSFYGYDNINKFGKQNSISKNRFIWNNKRHSNKQLKNRIKLFKGTQANCEGYVPEDKVTTVFNRIQQKAPHTIHFNKDKISPEVKGGTCSSMSFRFAKGYLHIKENMPTNPNGYKSLFGRVSKLGKKDFAKSSIENRIEQAAFNTIEVHKGIPEADYTNDKMQSLLNYHNLKIDSSSEEISTDAITERQFTKKVNALPNGIYALRIIKPEDNEKLEEHGHSVIYIKEDQFSAFYDPNYGAEAFPRKESGKVLFPALQTMKSHFQITKARFYRLSQQTA